MQKYVYLFELDSVRKSDREILIGQQALYDEIVGNGNIVVLTYNQLVDSRAFFSLLNSNEYYENLVKLFEKGAICISQFDDTRTISQYLINSLVYERSFIYSGWPLKSTQKRLLALIKRSLTYSDLNEINDYISNVRSDDEILDLFVEVVEELKNGKKEIRIQQTTLNVEQCKKILSNLFYLIKTVLRLSSIHTIYIKPKSQDRLNMSFYKYLGNAMQLTQPSNVDLWEKAKHIIRSLDAFKNKSNDRSQYHHDIYHAYKRDENELGVIDKALYQYAEAIVDLCYNYQLEYSIGNSSKHYNVDEFSSEYSEQWVTFSEDFFFRLGETWSLGDNDKRYLLDDPNSFEIYQPEKGFPSFCRAVRMIDYANEKRKKKTSEDVHRYEYNLKNQRKNNKERIEATIVKKIAFMIITIVVACLMELIINSLQNYFESIIPWNFVTETIIFLIVTELITWILSRLIKGFIQFSEAVGCLAQLVKDFVKIAFYKTRTYVDRCINNVDAVETYDEGKNIDYIKSDSIKKYIRMQSKDEFKRFFTESEIYKIADVTNNNRINDSVIKSLMRLEELYNYRFGVAYKSDYNTMVVDPIVTRHTDLKEEQIKPYYPYERVVSTSGRDGAVIIPKYKDKYVMLKQYRHSIREEQYCFPRGYAENGGIPEENAVKELKEEIKVDGVKSISLLNRVCPDSGLTGTKAYIYFAEIDNYEPHIFHEGIKEGFLVSENEIDEMIKANKINDGYTLSAWSLLKSYI